MTKAAFTGRWAKVATAGFPTVAIFVLFLAIAVAIRARDFGNPIIHVDEQYYLLVGDRMLHGAVPYIDIWDRKPVGLFLIFAAISLLPGDGILAATLFAAATTSLVAHVPRQGALSRSDRMQLCVGPAAARPSRSMSRG